MIIPIRDTIKERVRVGAEVFHNLKSVLKEKNLAKHLPEFSEAEVQARRGDYRKLVKIEGQ